VPTPQTPPERRAGVESDLLLRCSRGDEQALAELYDRTSAHVFGLALRILRDHAQAEAVTQEVYMALWRESGRFDPARGSAFGWLCSLAHRTAVERVRSAEAGRARDASADRVVDVATGTDSADRARAALAQLSQAQREAVELAYFEGYTHAQVSALLSIPLGTAKARIRDGLDRLRLVLVPAETHAV
jgi:RNA polymerase sigma-70 factor (ECF subfamily)